MGAAEQWGPVRKARILTPWIRELQLWELGTGQAGAFPEKGLADSC